MKNSKEINKDISEMTAEIESLQGLMNDFMNNIKFIQMKQRELKTEIDFLKGLENETESILNHTWL